MKVVFKVGGGGRTTPGDKWYKPVTSTPTAVEPVYTHIAARESVADNNVELPFVALSPKKSVYGGQMLTDGGGVKHTVVAASSRQNDDARRNDILTSSDHRGRLEANQEKHHQPHESLVKRLRERMAMEAALRNEANICNFYRLAILVSLLALLL
jgi:hypothetical protein